jgi:hypothetical protein
MRRTYLWGSREHLRLISAVFVRRVMTRRNRGAAANALPVSAVGVAQRRVARLAGIVRLRGGGGAGPAAAVAHSSRVGVVASGGHRDGDAKHGYRCRNFMGCRATIESCQRAYL